MDSETKNKLKSLVNRNMERKLNVVVSKAFPRHSVIFAKEHFDNRPIEVVEIGTSKGENAFSILKSLNVKRIYLIDPYEEYSDYKKSEVGRTQKNLSTEEKSAHDLLAAYKDKITWIRKYSDDAVTIVPNEIDFIYIDGNHEYDYVKRDIENYFPKLKEGGIIAGHDVSHHLFSPGIFRALMETFGKLNLYPFISRTDWYVVKHGNQKI
jgi:predicted O-methyltransferase YrrM